MAPEGVSVLAFLLCDQVLKEAGPPGQPSSVGGGQTLVRVFSEIYADVFPVVFPRLCVHIELRGIDERPQQFRLAIVGPDGKFRRAGDFFDVSITDDRDTWTNTTEFANVIFDQPGVYLVRLIAPDRLVAERTLVARLLSGPSEGSRLFPRIR